MSATLYWHDYETTGVDPAWDRPIQFAGVRTDPELTIIGEPLTHYCLPPLDRLPHPQASLVTGLTPQFVMEKGQSEPAFVAAIHRELAKPGTCGVGYNSIRFDDEVTRFALYRNFYDPYEREWKNGNSRWDIIDMLRLTRALRPEGIEWPDHEDGTPSFRLEDLTAANGLDHGAAHDALSDVYATIAVAKLVKTQQPKLYDYVYGHRSKQQVASLINVSERKPFLHVSSRLPRNNSYLAIMMPVCVHPTNRNALVAVNLMSDPDLILTLDSDTLRERLFTPTTELPSDAERVALKGIHMNRCPVVATTKLLDQSAAQRLDIDLERCETNYRRLRSHDIREKVQAVFANPEYGDASDAESALYEGFIPDRDRPLLARVRANAPDKLVGSDIEFHDQRYRELLFRYRARYAPETLNSAESDRWSNLRHKWLHGDAPGLLNIGVYNKELDELERRPENNDQDKAVLQALRQWGAYLINKP